MNWKGEGQEKEKGRLIRKRLGKKCEDKKEKWRIEVCSKNIMIENQINRLKKDRNTDQKTLEDNVYKCAKLDN